MSLDEIKVVSEIIENIVSTIAIIAAGVWSYFVFVLGRSHAVNIKLDLVSQYQFRVGKKCYVVLRIIAKNIGKTKAKNKGSYIALEEIGFEEQSENYPQRIDTQLDLDNARLYEIFLHDTVLEPNEAISDESIFLVDPSRIIKAGVFWTGDRSSWSSIHIIEPSLLDKKIAAR